MFIKFEQHSKKCKIENTPTECKHRIPVPCRDDDIRTGGGACLRRTLQEETPLTRSFPRARTAWRCATSIGFGIAAQLGRYAIGLRPDGLARR